MDPFKYRKSGERRPYSGGSLVHYRRIVQLHPCEVRTVITCSVLSVLLLVCCNLIWPSHNHMTRTFLKLSGMLTVLFKLPSGVLSSTTKRALATVCKIKEFVTSSFRQYRIVINSIINLELVLIVSHVCLHCTKMSSNLYIVDTVNDNVRPTLSPSTTSYDQHCQRQWQSLCYWCVVIYFSWIKD